MYWFGVNHGYLEKDGIVTVILIDFAACQNLIWKVTSFVAAPDEYTTAVAVSARAGAEVAWRTT